MIEHVDALEETYGDRIRVRVGALLVDRSGSVDRILLVEHRGDDDSSFWTPPGGAVEFGESLPEALVREVREETGLGIETDRLVYTVDFVRPPLHAVSFYFHVHLRSGSLRRGADPELEEDDQLITSVRYVSLEELPDLRVVPEGLTERLRRDVPRSFPGRARYLGTRR